MLACAQSFVSLPYDLFVYRGSVRSICRAGVSGYHASVVFLLTMSGGLSCLIFVFTFVVYPCPVVSRSYELRITMPVNNSRACTRALTLSMDSASVEHLISFHSVILFSNNFISLQLRSRWRLSTTSRSMANPCASCGPIAIPAPAAAVSAISSSRQVAPDDVIALIMPASKATQDA